MSALITQSKLEVVNSSRDKSLLIMASKENIDPKCMGNTDGTRTMKSKYCLEANIKEDNRFVRAPISDINSTVKRATVHREGSNDIITLSKKKVIVPLAPGKVKT